MNHRPVIVFLLGALACAAATFAASLFHAPPDLIVSALVCAPVLFVIAAASMAAAALVYFGGLSRHSVLAAVSTLYRVKTAPIARSFWPPAPVNAAY